MSRKWGDGGLQTPPPSFFGCWVWSICGLVGCTWLMYSLCMAHIWPMYDLYMVYIWPYVHICQVTLPGFLSMLTFGDSFVLSIAPLLVLDGSALGWTWSDPDPGPTRYLISFLSPTRNESPSPSFRPTLFCLRTCLQFCEPVATRLWTFGSQSLSLGLS